MPDKHRNSEGRDSLTDALQTTIISPDLPSLRFPKNVVISYMTADQLKSYALFPEEAAYTKNFSEKRLLDFRLGRACARESLSKAGITNYPVLIGKSREPVWPDSITGSISHCNNIAICAVSSTQCVRSIGIDIEQLDNEPFDLLSMVTSQQEIPLLAGLAEKCHYLSKLLFSAKESVYKCQYPLTARMLDFNDITLQIMFSNKTFSTSLIFNNNILEIHGAWGAINEYVITSAWLVNMRIQ